MGSSFLVLLLTVFVAFLGLLGVLSLAVTKTVNPSGREARSWFGGCAAALALVFLCGMGTVGTGAFLVAVAVGTAVDKNPIERIEIRRVAAADDGELTQDWRHGPVHVLFTVRGDAGRELVELMREVVELEQGVSLEDHLTVHRRTSSDGTEYRIFEFRLPWTEDDLADFQREIERELDGLRVHLPASVVIDFEGAERFY